MSKRKIFKIILIILIISWSTIGAGWFTTASKKYVHVCDKKNKMSTIHINDKYCGSCSEKLTENNVYIYKKNYCKNCENELVNSKYCEKCGGEIDSFYLQPFTDTIWGTFKIFTAVECGLVVSLLMLVMLVIFYRTPATESEEMEEK